ncbi:putative quinol monooxygenase [Cytophagaceae bacterium DM2B3-1]|uniref:Quinol monooxygenase n=1 Tax=Xanthocytophaga flava TaxID=3048013 RepID=A0AAE3QPQ5_9BACT|nr:putative quinol monooxygenase [Xanthocytophaga flavus]MDJ1480866.1 putative quinol monooxygenase [Xanthocytophaga flavus]MDJ1498431.1 putative quinol monooxygenase [Xanthocytophaga flavus]
MSQTKYIIQAEVSVLPDYLSEVKALAAATLLPTLKEPGCEAFYQTSKADDPTTLIFFEVFASREAFDIHMNASYTKEFFAGLQGKLAGKPVSRTLQEL